MQNLEFNFSPTPEQLDRIPPWLRVLGRQVHERCTSLLKPVDCITSEAAVRGLLDRLDLFLLEPLQVSMIKDGAFVYHDYIRRQSTSNRDATDGDDDANFPSVRTISYGLWPVWKEILAHGNGVCYWRDMASNRKDQVVRLPRHTVCIFSMCGRTQLATEVHWGGHFDGHFEEEVTRVRDYFRSLDVRVVDVTEHLLDAALRDSRTLFELGPLKFENLVAACLERQGLHVKSVGHTFARDGGFDLLFWPKNPLPFRFLGAVQVKFNKNPNKKTGAEVVRDFSGALARLGPIKAGIIVTNTGFTTPAEWEAQKATFPIDLRGYRDVLAWLFGSTGSDWKAGPLAKVIELGPGISISLE